MVHKLNVDNIRGNSLQVVLPELSNESPLDEGYEVDVTPIARKDEVSSETRRTYDALVVIAYEMIIICTPVLHMNIVFMQAARMYLKSL